MVTKESRNILKKGDVAPDFYLKGTDGKKYSLDDFSDYKGVLIVFTCNHCPYAQAKFNILNKIAEEYSEIAVLGINPNNSNEYPEDSFSRMKELTQEGKIKYDAYLRDETQETARKYGAICTPDPFLFKNEDGEFHLVYHGRLDDALTPDEKPTKEHIIEVIENILQNKEIKKDFLPSRGCSIKWKEYKEVKKPFNNNLKFSNEKIIDFIDNIKNQLKEEEKISISPPGEGWKTSIEYKNPIELEINSDENSLDLSFKFSN